MIIMKYLPKEYPCIKEELEEFYKKLEVYDNSRTFVAMIEMQTAAHDLFCVLKANEVIGNLSPTEYVDITSYCKEVGSYD